MSIVIKFIQWKRSFLDQRRIILQSSSLSLKIPCELFPPKAITSPKARQPRKVILLNFKMFHWKLEARTLPSAVWALTSAAARSLIRRADTFSNISRTKMTTQFPPTFFQQLLLLPRTELKIPTWGTIYYLWTCFNILCRYLNIFYSFRQDFKKDQITR